MIAMMTMMRIDWLVNQSNDFHQLFRQIQYPYFLQYCFLFRLKLPRNSDESDDDDQKDNDDYHVVDDIDDNHDDDADDCNDDDFGDDDDDPSLVGRQPWQPPF